MTTETVSDQLEKRARIPETHAEVNSEAFAMMLESDSNLETFRVECRGFGSARARPRDDGVK